LGHGLVIPARVLNPATLGGTFINHDLFGGVGPWLRTTSKCPETFIVTAAFIMGIANVVAPDVQ
jgi:hypothetical protein